MQVVAPCVGGSGEPVVLLHALGLGADAYRYGEGPTLVGALSDAGFTVYLAGWRGDAESCGPTDDVRIDFDAIVEQDVPALLEAVRRDGAFPRVAVVGHGFGGQIALAHAARAQGDGLSCVAALCSPVVFGPPEGDWLRWMRAAAWLTGRWRVPGRRVASVAAPWLRDDGGSGARLRGVLWHAAEDVPASLVAQVAAWMSRGRMVDRTGLYDYTSALAAVRAPLFVGYTHDDPLCPPAAALAAVEAWGGDDARVCALPDGLGHFGAVLSGGPPAWAPLVSWLAERRRVCWDAGPDAFGATSPQLHATPDAARGCSPYGGAPTSAPLP